MPKIDWIYYNVLADQDNFKDFIFPNPIASLAWVYNQEKLIPMHKPLKNANLEQKNETNLLKHYYLAVKTEIPRLQQVFSLLIKRKMFNQNLLRLLDQ